MTEQTTLAVRRSVTVQAPPERAFDVFTYGFSSWWPLETHHIAAATAARAGRRGRLAVVLRLAYSPAG